MITEEEFITKYAGHLNEQQLTAVRAVNGPVLLLAVPGSGKTTVLIHRLGYMLMCRDIPPEEILTLTYTVAATKDMKSRFESRFGSIYEGALEFRTINGICAKVIQEYGRMIGRTPFSLITDEKLITKLFSDILVRYLPEYPTESDIKTARTLVTYCKNMMLSEDEIDELGQSEDFPLKDTYRQYNEYLTSNRLMDYDDQMIYTYGILKSSPEFLNIYRERFRYICVDEAQDTSKIQHMIISLLAGADGNLFMVGDEDQSIYGFRAAYPEALLNFEKEHRGAKVLIMDRNFRSNAKIVAAADLFIQYNQLRHEKHIVATRPAASDIKYTKLTNRSKQYAYLADTARNNISETAVLYRDNESVIPLVDILDREKIPYRIKNADMTFFTNRIVADVTNFMKFAQNPKDTSLFMKTYYKCQMYLKKKQAEEMCLISRQKQIPVLSAAGYVTGLDGYIKSRCKTVQDALKRIAAAPPSRGMFEIEDSLDYVSYLKKNHISDNKLYLLKMLASKEQTIDGFLSRLDYLQELFRNNAPDYNCSFILSTIHSSKGLEYDRVFLMDVCDDIFPVEVTGSEEEKQKHREEERRLFYVGVTRAKNTLEIFTFDSERSSLVKELTTPVKKKNEKEKTEKKKSLSHRCPGREELTVGRRIIQDKYGSGTIINTSLNGKNINFSVKFDMGDIKTFAFPAAFEKGMILKK